MNKTKNQYSILAILFAATTVATVGEAKTCVWSGAGTPTSSQLRWTDPGNWEDGDVPVDGDSVVLVPKGDTAIRVFKDLTLENLYMTNSVGATFAGDDHVLTLTGIDSIIKTDTKDANFNAKIKIEAGAKLLIDNAKSLSQKSPGEFVGSGEIEKIGSGDFNFYQGNDDFAGNLVFRSGAPKIMAAGLVGPFGGSESTAHFYTSPDIRYRTTISNHIYLHSGSSATSLTTYQTVTLNGDVTFMAETVAKNPYLQGGYNQTYYDADFPPAYIVNGKLICDNSNYTVTPTFYSTGTAPMFYVELNCDFEGWSTPLVTSTKTLNSDKVTIYLNKPFKTTSAIGINLKSSDKLICGAANVLKGKDIGFYYGSSVADSIDEVFDLNGYDQKVNSVVYVPKSNYKLEGSIKSSRGPATLTTSLIKADSRTVAATIDDSVSLVLNKGGATTTGDVVFKGGSTSGWIFSDWAGCDFSRASFSNLSGVGLKGAGIAYVGAATALKDGIKLDFNGRTTGYLCVETGTNIKAAQVVDGGVDVPAGVYCREGAGIDGAIEAAWLGGASDDFNGTVTVAAHEASAIWTGAAGDGNLTTGENWGSGVAPDLSDASATVDFRYATVETPIVLSDTVTVASRVTCGDICQGVPTFSGSGTLGLSGSDITVNALVFTENTSMIWNGPGTLILKGGASMSDGDLIVNAGKVILKDGSTWIGNAAVSSGAELEFAGVPEKPVFTENSKVDLYGKLILGSGIETTVKALTLNGRLARHNKAYGSTMSSAICKDDVHFGGLGTVVSLAKPGVVLIVR